MIAAEGILTSRGGLVSHAAVVARGMGTPAVCGASALRIDVGAKQFSVDGTIVHEGDVISINGTTGEIVLGAVPVITPEPSGPFEVILSWADEFRRLGVRTNADLPHDAQVARRFGAEGIGLCRTEHMFLGDRLPLVQRFILAARRSRGAAGARRARAAAARRLRRHPRGDGRPARHRAAARSTAARVPARHRGAARAARQGGARREGTGAAARGRAVARGEPDARDARRATRGAEARAVPHAGARPVRGRDRALGRRWQPRSSRS